MQTRKLLEAASCLTVLGLLAANCALGASPTPTSKPAAATAAAAPSPSPKPSIEQARYGGILPRANFEEAPHLDVHQAMSVTTMLSQSNVYNGLVRYDTVDVNKVVGDLAEKWDISPNRKTYTFHLHKDVKWHDGKPLTAEDVKFSLERMAFWKEQGKIVSPRAGQMLTAVEKIDILEPSTVHVNLKHATPPFLAMLATGWVLIMPKHVIEAKGDMKKDSVGTGPFVWKRWNWGVSQELVKNNDYFVKGLPYLDGITIYPIKDDATRFAAFRTGRVRMTTIGSRAMSHAQAEVVRRDMADYAVVLTHSAATRFLIFMNSKVKPWDDIRVRQAVDMAYDRKAAITVNQNVGKIGTAMDPGGAWGLPEDELARRPGYHGTEDIQKAKGLLAEAGYPQGFKTRIQARAGGAAEQQGVVARDQLARIGIEATMEVRETTLVDERLAKGDFELSVHNPGDDVDDPDPVFSGYYITDGTRNYGKFSHKELDDLFWKQSAIVDQTERKKVVLDMQRRILDLAIYPVIFWDLSNFGMWKEVRDYKPNFVRTHNNLDHVWLAK